MAVTFALAFCFATPATSEERAKPLRIYIDASRSGGSGAAGTSIERGVRTALSEVEDRLAGQPVEIVLKDHRGNSRRSQRHLEQFLEDERGLLVFGGMHSPPLLAARDFIQESGILLLDPWAAAGPITRGPYRPSWIFRLSVDDTLAGEAITRFAVDQEGLRRVALLVEDTGWGKSNIRTMKAALKKRKLRPAGSWRFRWGLGEVEAAQIAAEIGQSDADVVYLVANAEEGELLAKALARLPRPPQVRSHWGISGGSFADHVDFETREKIGLVFLQTRFSFLSENPPDHARRVLKSAQRLFPELTSAAELKAPTGFIHAYDLTRLLIAATEQLELSDDIGTARRQVRDALEAIPGPVEGLVRNYERPFRPMSDDNSADHEALGIGDLRMGQFSPSGVVRLLETPPVPARQRD